MSYADTRKPYEFSPQTKQEALLRSPVCERCGNPHNLNFDHIIPCWFAINFPVFATEIIKSLANCRILCTECHKKRGHYDSTEILSLAPVVITRFVESIRNESRNRGVWKGETTINGRSHGVVYVASEQLTLNGTD